MKHADKELNRQVRALGFTLVDRSTRKHQVWRHPNGTTLVTPRSIGEGRGYQNALSLARRLARSGDV
jgi:hypothetical protein